MNKFNSLPILERPYEKCILYGEKSLNIAELLAILINTGTKEKTALEIAQELININADNYNSLQFLQEISINELTKIKGIGTKKAIKLKVVGEICRRINSPINFQRIYIKSSEDVAKIFMQELRFEKREIIKLILLNNNNSIKKIINIASGNSNRAVFDIKQILSEPIKLEISKIILVHNHPSGRSNPSNEDILTTRKIKEAAEIMGITLLDHIIIGDGEYKSII